MDLQHIPISEEKRCDPTVILNVPWLMKKWRAVLRGNENKSPAVFNSEECHVKVCPLPGVLCP